MLVIIVDFRPFRFRAIIAWRASVSSAVLSISFGGSGGGGGAGGGGGMPTGLGAGGKGGGLGMLGLENNEPIIETPNNISYKVKK